MSISTISSKYQVVIPKKIREQFHLRPGQKLMFIPYKNSMRVVVVPPIEEAQGFLDGISSDVEREREERV
jgi:AbrB family looped-hinge helix DNA binding protein